MQAGLKEPRSFDDEFHIGITMAGAASAGCYTAGVMDYLFEILNLWEKAKNEQEGPFSHHKAKIPNHQVVIEAMGGTSAGGMTATMSALYALNGKIKPVTTPGEAMELKDNLLYDCWVLMDDDNKKDKRPLFEKIWDTEDLENGRFQSLLNSKFIDTIADRAFQVKNADLKDRVSKLPSYVSKNLQLLYSHCFLRGIPMEVNFETIISKNGKKSVIPNHTTYEHFIMTQYHLSNGENPDPDKYLWLNPYESPFADTLKLSTKATGAFPVGLVYREFGPDQLGEDYLRNAIKRVITGKFGSGNPDPGNEITLNYFPKDYSTVTVDGGAINNEPYREVLSILQDQVPNDAEEGYHHSGVIMIDPFPDRAQLAKTYEKPNDVIDVAMNIIGTLTDQSRVKRREMLETDASKYFRSLIFPRKWKTDENGKPVGQPGTIASASAMAFGGFLDIRFRQHDFFLGRNNARNFFRYYFTFPYKKGGTDNHPIHRNWTDEMVNAFLFEKDGTNYLPIIPDLNQILEQDRNEVKEWYDYDIASTPKYDPENLFKVKKKIKNRLRMILDILQHRDFTETIKKQKEDELGKLPQKQRTVKINQEKELEQRRQIADTWLKKEYNDGLLAKTGALIGKPFIFLGTFFAKRTAAKIITKKAIQAILLDLAGKGLLEEEQAKLSK